MNGNRSTLRIVVALALAAGIAPVFAQDASPFEGDYGRYTYPSSPGAQDAGGFFWFYSDQAGRVSIGFDGAISGHEMQGGTFDWTTWWESTWEYQGQVAADGEMVVVTRLTYIEYLPESDEPDVFYRVVAEWEDRGDAAFDASGILSFQGTRSIISSDVLLDENGLGDDWIWEGDGAGVSEGWKRIGAAPAGGPPAAPTDLTAAAFKSKNKRHVDLGWSQSTSSGVVQNRIYRSTGGQAFSLLATVQAAESYRDTTVSAGEYSYRVTAVRADGGESAASAAVSVAVK